MRYQTASEVEYTHRLFSQPIPIVAACNRLRMAQVREINRAVLNEAGKGLIAFLCGAAIALVIASCTR